MADHFSEKAKEYDKAAERMALAQAIGGAVAARIPFTPDMAVMDFGAGTGLISAQIADRVASISAVDTSPAMLAELMAKEALRGKVWPVERDIVSDPLKERFDVIVSAMALHHVKDTEALLRTFAAHAKAGAWLALADLDVEDGTFHPAHTEGIHHTGFDRVLLANQLKDAGFEGIAFTTAHHLEKEGRPYSVFLVTARLA